MVENMRRLEIAPGDIDIVVLSHGHWDHTTGMHGLTAELRAREPPGADPSRVLDAAAGSRFAGRDPLELPATSRGALEGAGFEIVEREQPSFLLDGSLLVTGEVDRTTEFEPGFPVHQAHRHGAGSPTR